MNPVAHAGTVPGVLERAAHGRPDAPALIEKGGVLSYRELYAAARRAAAGFAALGVVPGDRVAVWLPNGSDWAIAAYGALCAGAAVVALNTRYTVAEAADILGRAGCAVAVAHGSFLGRDLGRVAAEAGACTVAGPDLPAGDGRDRPGGEVDRRLRMLGPDDISHVQYTSGTTGRPKGALLRHGAMVATTRTWVEITGLRAADRYPVVAPFSHIGGHKTGLLACAVSGAAALPQPTLDAAALSRAIAEHGVTFLQGPPAMYQALLDAGAPSGSVRIAVTGAASVPPSLIRALRAELGVRTVFTAYGLTEASGVCTMTRADDEADVVAETAGRPIPGVEIRIDGGAGGAGGADSAGAETAGPGEILVRGTGLMAGYLDDAEGTAEAMQDGWLRTGDVGVLDGTGRLRVVDRLKDLVIVGGLNAYPAEIERVLLEHPAVRQAAVVGVEHERLGEVPVAFVVGAQAGVPAVTGPDLTDLTDLTGFCRTRLAGFKVPRSVWWLPALPVNTAGKVAKPELRAEAVRRIAGEPGPS